MFASAAALGFATVVFDLTHTFWVAMICLVVLGIGDMVSVFIRSLRVQLETRDEIRVRVFFPVLWRMQTVEQVKDERTDETSRP